MNKQGNQLHLTALVLGILVIGGFFYLSGAGIYGELHQLVSSASTTSTVTIPAAEFADLQRTARQYQLLVRANESVATSSFVTSLEERDGINASVIGRPPQSPYDTLLLDAGEIDGVTLASGVWWPAGVYLGRVVKVNKHTSLVELITSSGVNHPATIKGIPVTAIGRGGDGLYMQVPDSETITVGMAVVSDVYELPIGVVSAVERLPTTNLQAVYATRFISNASIENVYVQKQ